MVTPITPEYLARSGTEHGEQSALFCWAALNRARFPDLRWMYAIPNGGDRKVSVAASLKAEGVKSGVADVCLPVPVHSNGYVAECGLYIEMKRADGVPSDVSKAQLDFGAFVTLKGFHWYVAFGWVQAVNIIESYLASIPPALSAHQQTVFDQMMEIVNAPT
jgi:hypothetical protein